MSSAWQQDDMVGGSNPRTYPSAAYHDPLVHQQVHPESSLDNYTEQGSSQYDIRPDADVSDNVDRLKFDLDNGATDGIAGVHAEADVRGVGPDHTPYVASTYQQQGGQGQQVLTERQVSRLTPQQARNWDYGGNPLAHIHTNDGTARLPATAAQFQPGLYKVPEKPRANPAPLGLSGFALATFVLSLVNLGAHGAATPSIVIGPALAYGGLCQLLAGMWEIAFGNTFGGWAFSSYGGFWISLGIILTPGGFDIISRYGGETEDFWICFGFVLIGFFVYTFIVWLATLRSTLIFSSLILTVWLTFLMLGCAYLDNVDAVPNAALVRAGGAFGIVASFLAWWAMLAGLLEPSNSFFLLPVVHFPWSAKGRERRGLEPLVDAEKNE